ncbi:ribosomal protein S8 [Hymenopellis radicata]|nr:ribosomal protein S8 [Hymenopellis radicata]
MPLPFDLCARLQNAFRARHQRLAVEHTTQNLGILSILLRHGFISNITRGSVAAPSAEHFAAAPEAQRRIWVDLKYRDDLPVLNQMSLISKPSKKVHMELGELRLICSGRRTKTVAPLGMGEIAVVRTKNRENEWVEAREAMQLKLGGEVVCRVS